MLRGEGGGREDDGSRRLGGRKAAFERESEARRGRKGDWEGGREDLKSESREERAEKEGGTRDEPKAVLCHATTHRP